MSHAICVVPSEAASILVVLDFGPLVLLSITLVSWGLALLRRFRAAALLIRVLLSTTTGTLVTIAFGLLAGRLLGCSRSSLAVESIDLAALQIMTHLLQSIAEGALTSDVSLQPKVLFVEMAYALPGRVIPIS